MVRTFMLGAMLGIGLASMAQVATAEDAPKTNKGFSTKKSVVVDLGSQIDGMQGRQLRLRLLHIEPGGHIGLHSHKDRPAVVYFLQGTDTVYQGNGTSKVFHPGDVSSATNDTTHWHKNTGNDPVELIAVDILHKTK